MKDRTSHQGERISGGNTFPQGPRTEGSKGVDTEHASKAELYSRQEKVAEKDVKNDSRKS